MNQCKWLTILLLSIYKSREDRHQVAVLVGVNEITFMRVIFLKVKYNLAKHVNYVIDYTTGKSY